MRLALLTVVALALALLTPALPAQTKLAVTGLDADAPLTITASATASELVVELDLQSGWHVYGRDVGGGQPVGLTLTDGGVFGVRGPLQLPSTADGKISGRARLVLPITPVTNESSRNSKRVLDATFSFQVCDALQCLLPMEVGLQGEVGPLAVLVVVDGASPRAERIARWFAARGFVATLSTYAEVTLAQCDGADVVVADSNTFREVAKGARQQVLKFPRTTSPIIAVGFLGTELVEAHGVAMTSGYV